MLAGGAIATPGRFAQQCDRRPLVIAPGGFVVLLASARSNRLRFYSMGQLPLTRAAVAGHRTRPRRCISWFHRRDLLLLAARALGWSLFPGMSLADRCRAHGRPVEREATRARADGCRRRQDRRDRARSGRQREAVVEEEKRRKRARADHHRDRRRPSSNRGAAGREIGSNASARRRCSRGPKAAAAAAAPAGRPSQTDRRRPERSNSPRA